MLFTVIMLYGRTVSHFSILPGAIASTLDKTFDRLSQLHFPSALQSRDTAMWTDSESVRQKIANRLGWVDAVEFSRQQLPQVRSFAERTQLDGFTDVVLLGMGGSSLAPEVMRAVIGVAPGFPRFHVLDSVDPDAVRDAFSAAATSLFVFASKSGGTIEPSSMAAEARRLIEPVYPDWGSRFVAITDEGTELHRLAETERFRATFVNPSTIGGRFSALSLFGLVPAALMGIDVETLLREAGDMEDRCYTSDVRANPGTALGAFAASGALNGRDKLTLLLPPRLASFGLWVEQLVAESTGKEGKGVVPIAGEAGDAPIGDDRVAVAINLPDDAPDGSLRERLLAAGTPIFDIDMPGVLSLGAQFLLWEVATAAAGRLLDINPFDEPNVQQAKDATRVLLDSYSAHKRLPAIEAHAARDSVRYTVSRRAEEVLSGADALRFLDVATTGDYVALLPYLPPNDEALGKILIEARRQIGTRTRCATMLGYGPRYLHSTGQLHKGGANNGVFIVITAEPGSDLAIPGQPYSFSVLETAQAIGDFQSLERTGRRALLVQVPSRTPDHLSRALSVLWQS